MESPIGTYEDWIALTAQERDHIQREVWNVYERNGFGIAVIAAGRLALMHSLQVIDVRIGSYHGGEYVLHMCVRDEHHTETQNTKNECFEGFRTAWFAMAGWEER